jgi:hypothetical protein
MTAQVVLQGLQAKYTMYTLHIRPWKMGNHYISLTLLSNSRWINYIEFGKKKQC